MRIVRIILYLALFNLAVPGVGARLQHRRDGVLSEMTMSVIEWVAMGVIAVATVGFLVWVAVLTLKR